MSRGAASVEGTVVGEAGRKKDVTVDERLASVDDNRAAAELGEASVIEEEGEDAE